MMLGIGPLELVLILAIVLVLFGAKRLPEAGRSLGTGLREFKDGIKNPAPDDERALDAPAAGSDADAAGVPKVRSAHD